MPAVFKLGVLFTPVPTCPSTFTIGQTSLTHLPMSTSFPRYPHIQWCVLKLHPLAAVLHSEHLLATFHSPLLSAGSTDVGSSIGITSAVFFAGLLAGAALAGLLAGAALAGPAGALSVVCYHWKKKERAKTKGK